MLELKTFTKSVNYVLRLRSYIVNRRVYVNLGNGVQQTQMLDSTQALDGADEGFVLFYDTVGVVWVIRCTVWGWGRATALAFIT